MKPLLVLHATREGQAAHIARRIAMQARAQGVEADLHDAARSPQVSLSGYGAAMLIASVHMQRHEPEMRRFAARHVRELNEMPSAFISVGLSQAGAEDASATAESRAQCAAGAEGMIARFLNETGWHPARIKAVAGALRYSKYGALVRFVMKRIARRMGAPDDASKDYEYTDWRALESFAAESFASWRSTGDPLTQHGGTIAEAPGGEAPC